MFFYSDFLKSFNLNFRLIYELSKREILSRYKGSLFGNFWALITPVLMLSIYTFVFSEIFKAKWGEGCIDSKGSFAVILFAGLIVYTFFAEVINKSPSLIINNQNFVKKIVFPLEILTIVSFMTTLFNMLISFCLLLISAYFIIGGIPLNAFLLPIIVMPLFFMSLGLSWILSAIGVYLRDIGHAVALIMMVLMFLSPIFYPVSAIPEDFRQWIYINPLTSIIESVRNIVIFDHVIDYESLIKSYIVSFHIAVFGLWFFNKLKKGFADVL